MGRITMVFQSHLSASSILLEKLKMMVNQRNFMLFVENDSSSIKSKWRLGNSDKWLIRVNMFSLVLILIPDL